MRAEGSAGGGVRVVQSAGGGGHDVFAVDARNAVEALRFLWGGTFSISYRDYGYHATWEVKPGHEISVDGATPDDLNRAITEVWGSVCTPA